MKRILLILSYLLLTIGPVLAATSDAPLAELNFGAAPSADMLCTAGPCAGGKIALSHRAPTQEVAFYKKPSDLTHIDGVEITAPVYAYYQEELFQVFFKLLGPTEEGERLVDAFVDRLRQCQAVTLLHDNFDADRPGEAHHSRIYLLEDGRIVSASRTQEDGRWQPPRIRLYEPRRMDQVRLAFNPDYLSHGY